MYCSAYHLLPSYPQDSQIILSLRPFCGASDRRHRRLHTPTGTLEHLCLPEPPTPDHLFNHHQVTQTQPPSNCHQDLTAVLDKHASLKTSTRQVGNTDMCWMSPEANTTHREKQRNERRYEHTKSDEDCKKFRSSCRKMEQLVREACSRHVRSEIADIAQNPRLLGRLDKS